MIHTTDPAISDDEMQKFVDGELSETRFRKIKCLLDSDPEAMVRVEQYQQLTALIAGLNRSVLSEPIPESMRTFSEINWQRRLLPIAASFLLFSIGVIVGWQMVSTTEHHQSTQLMSDSAEAHSLFALDVTNPVEVAIDQGAVLQSQKRLGRWLTKRIGVEIKLPNVAYSGYQLIGGRVLPGNPVSPHAMLVYEKPNGDRMSVYITRPEEPQHVNTHFVQQGNLGVFYWLDEVLSCAVVLEVGPAFDRNTMMDIANDIYEQIEI